MYHMPDRYDELAAVLGDLLACYKGMPYIHARIVPGVDAVHRRFPAEIVEDVAIQNMPDVQDGNFPFGGVFHPDFAPKAKMTVSTMKIDQWLTSYAIFNTGVKPDEGKDQTGTWIRIRSTH